MNEVAKTEETDLEFSKRQTKEFAAAMKTIENNGLKTTGYNPFTGSFLGESNGLTLSRMDSKNISKWLESPLNHEQQLRKLSKLLYNVSGEYRGMIDYYVNMARFYYLFEFNGDKNDHAPNKLKNELRMLSSEFSKMNIAHEKTKVFDTVMKEDVYYGYEISDKHSYFLMKLNPDFCRISGQSDGMWVFEYDFSYFKGREELLDSFPTEFRTKYNRYSNNHQELRWQTLSFDKSVVYKFNENQQEIIPPLSVAFEGIIDLSEYKGLKKVGAKIDNYLILHQKVPMFNDNDKNRKQNNFMIDSQTMQMFHSMLDESLPDEIGAVVSPMDIEPIQLDKSREPSDKVAEATRDVYNSVGVNQYLFNPDKNSTAGLSKSITKDEALVIDFYQQVARWMNRKLKINHPKWKHWNIKLLGTTYQSEKEYADFLIQLGTLGFPVAGAIASMIGQDVSSVESMSYLENEVLNLRDSMVPFSSSHTGGNKAENGRPEIDDDKISDSGQANRDSNEGVSGGEK